MFTLQSRYVIQDCVQQTAFGAVYLGFDQRQELADIRDLGSETHTKPDEHDEAPPSARAIAIKESSLNHAECLLTQQIVTEDPWQEWRVAKTIMTTGGHANVVQFYDRVQAFGSIFLVMELCPLGDLHSVLMSEPDQRLPEDKALECVRQIACGMAFLHASDIAHRDLSLENVLVSQDRTYKICDFGLSCHANQSAIGVVGKPYYMAPEVVGGDTDYDPIQADIWSLGVILFILVSGSPLFEGAGPTCPGFCLAQQSGVQAILNYWGMERLVSPSTVDLLNRMIQVDLSKRFTSMEQVLAHPALCL